MRASLSLGKLGERIAKDYLLEHGYKFVEQNFRCRLGEIDIIVMDKKTLVFVEVKTRLNTDTISPEESVNSSKVSKIKRTIQFYLLDKEHKNLLLRIDFVGIVLNWNNEILRINLIKNIEG